MNLKEDRDFLPSDVDDMIEDNIILANGVKINNDDYNRAKKIYYSNIEIQNAMNEDEGIDMIHRLFEAKRGHYTVC